MEFPFEIIRFTKKTIWYRRNGMNQIFMRDIPNIDIHRHGGRSWNNEIFETGQIFELYPSVSLSFGSNALKGGYARNYSPICS